jgi:hypothetical protein
MFPSPITLMLLMDCLLSEAEQDAMDTATALNS